MNKLDILEWTTSVNENYDSHGSNKNDIVLIFKKKTIKIIF